MKIVQILPTLAYGDAIGNNVLALDAALRAGGYETEVYAENIDKRIRMKNVQYISKYKDKETNVILFHLSIGSELVQKVLQFKSRVFVVYHNVTPSEFWKGYSRQAEELCEFGISCVEKLSSKPEMCIADSAFNKLDLRRLGYQCPIEVLPILIAFEDFSKTPNELIVKKYKDGEYVNIVFTGRIAPNKKQEDIISAFYYYKNYINPKSRLILAGSYQKKDVYYQKLKSYVEQLELNDVIFTGHIPFDEILAYYHVADIFLCLSEHEGFCVPLVEAMYFGIPIIAYDSTAVGETLGGSGLLLNDKNPKVVAEAIDKVVNCRELQEIMVQNEKIRLADFDNERIKKQFLGIMQQYLEKSK